MVGWRIPKSVNSIGSVRRCDASIVEDKYLWEIRQVITDQREMEEEEEAERGFCSLLAQRSTARRSGVATGQRTRGKPKEIKIFATTAV